MLPVLHLTGLLELYIATSSTVGDFMVLPGKVTRVHNALREALPYCAPANLFNTDYMVRQALAVFDNPKAVPVDKQQSLKGLPDTLLRELMAQLYVVPKPQHRQYVFPPPIPETAKGAERAAAEEAYAGARCIGFGEPTACALHLMRVIEWGGRVIAASLQIDISGKTLGGIASQVQDVVREKRKKDELDSYAEEVYNGLVVDLQAFARGYRNPTAHDFRQYTEQEAMNLLHLVMNFIDHLSKTFGKDLNNPQIPKKP